MVVQKFFQRRVLAAQCATLIVGVSMAGYVSAQSPASGTMSATSNSSDGGNQASVRTSLEMVSPQAQAHIDYALNLAERGAIQSAQSEFVLALDLIANALDADVKDGGRSHARAAKAGLT